MCALPVRYKQLLQSFSTREVLRWSVFSQDYAQDISGTADVFGGEGGKQRLKDLALRVIEHTILVVVEYYSQIRTGRLAEILDLSLDDVSWAWQACGWLPHMARMLLACSLLAGVSLVLYCLRSLRFVMFAR